VGKGSVVKLLLERDPTLVYSVSAKTRAPRPDEVDGRDYRFMPEDEFERLVEDGAFLEWAEMFGHRSGTLRAPVEEALASGRDVIAEIDVQGARTMKEQVPDAVLVFIVPPSREELERRLRARGTEDPEELRERLRVAFEEELPQRSWFDHVVVNDELERAADEVLAIIESYRSEQRTQP
jgi:guanylate kinase